MTLQLVIGFLLGILIGVLAWRAGALTPSGAWAAALTGGLVFGLGGWPWAILLLTFFISSSALSRAFGRRKTELSEKFSKGHRRDWGQVLANGGLGAVLALALTFQPNAIWPWLAFAGAMAAVNADTWGTELGVLSPSPPRLVTNGQPVPRGTSGGITLWGSLAALGGAGLIGLFAGMLHPQSAFLSGLVGATLGGLSGAFFDSFLGATVQAIYYCPSCEKETERHPVHTCGIETRQIRGWRWLNNDWVNFACSLVGAAVAVLLGSLF